MHKEKRALKKMATIKIEPYLAEYVIAKYGTNTEKGLVNIPYNTDWKSHTNLTHPVKVF